MPKSVDSILEDIFEECEQCAQMGEKAMCFVSKSFKKCPVLTSAKDALLKAILEAKPKVGFAQGGDKFEKGKLSGRIQMSDEWTDAIKEAFK